MDSVTTLVSVYPTGIAGVMLQDLKEIDTEGGPVLHMLRSDNPLYNGFGEVYFSIVLRGAVKAWKRHRLQTQHFAVPTGLIDIVIYDPRETSTTFGAVATFRLGRPGHYQLLRIPPHLWYGFTCVSPETAVLANCVDMPHAPTESERVPADSTLIPYTWA